MIIAGTGHRPDKLGGWDNVQAFHNLVEFAVEVLEEIQPIGVVSGMAAGWDLALAHAAMETDTHLLAAIPFEGQENRWSTFWKQVYNESRGYATEVRVLYTPDTNVYHEVAKALNDRNHWMVSYIKGKNGKIVALWNGTKGGTANCVRSAERAGVEVVNYWNKYLSQSS